MMRAVLLGTDGSLEVRQVPKPAGCPGEVVLRVTACGICRSDLRIAQRGVEKPLILGHEIVARDGSALFAVDPLIPCRRCRNCAHGKFNVCEKPSIVGMTRSGGYSQYVAVPHAQIYPIPSDLRIEDAVLVEPLSCVLHGYELLRPAPESAVLIIGAGTIGLLWLQVLKHVGRVRVTQIDEVESRARVAQDLEADSVFHITAHCLRDELRNMRFDAIVDATGNLEAVASVLPLLARGGALMCFGVYATRGVMDLPLAQLASKEQTLLTSRMYIDGLTRAVRFLKDGIVQGERLVTSVVPLSRVPEALRGLDESRHTSIKTVIDPGFDWL